VAAFALRVPIVRYLRECPLPEARQAVAELAKTHADVVRSADLYPFLPSTASAVRTTKQAKRKSEPSSSDKSVDGQALEGSTSDGQAQDGDQESPPKEEKSPATSPSPKGEPKEGQSKSRKPRPKAEPPVPVGPALLGLIVGTSCAFFLAALLFFGLPFKVRIPWLTVRGGQAVPGPDEAAP